MSSSSSDSLASGTDTGRTFVSINTAVLTFMLCGMVSTLVEMAGYWPVTEFSDLLLPSTPSQRIQTGELVPDLKSAVFKFWDIVKVAQFYTVHIYLSTYFLLPYPLIMNKQRLLLAPWLICSMLRSVLLNLLASLAGVTLCAAQPTLHYPCLQYVALRGAEFCMSLYLWTNVHSFYYLVDDRSPFRGIKNAIKAFRRVAVKTPMKMSVSSHASALNDLIYEKLDDLSLETTLVERAAMAWIAREILECREDSMTEEQFSHYLAQKATSEMRDMIKEIMDKKIEEMQNVRKSRVKEGRNDSLYMNKQVAEHQSVETPMGKSEAFEKRKDPLKRFRHLQSSLRDSTVNSSLRDEPNALIDQISLSSSSIKTSPAEKSVQVQTDPLTPVLAALFDTLEASRASDTKLKTSEILND